MIEALLANALTKLQAMQGTGKLLDGVTTVAIGDNLPRATDLHPLVTLDDAMEIRFGPRSYQPGEMVEVHIGLVARLYVCSLTKADVPKQLLRNLTWRTDDAGNQAGLIPALLKMMSLEGGVAGFIVEITDETRPINKKQRPQGRFTAGVEIPFTARGVVVHP